MEKRYLIFSFEPYQKCSHFPFFAKSREEAMRHLRELGKRRGLFYVDLFCVSDELEVAHFDNEINEGELKKIFDRFESEGTAQ